MRLFDIIASERSIDMHPFFTHNYSVNNNNKRKTLGRKYENAPQENILEVLKFFVIGASIRAPQKLE